MNGAKQALLPITFTKLQRIRLSFKYLKVQGYYFTAHIGSDMCSEDFHYAPSELTSSSPISNQVHPII